MLTKNNSDIKLCQNMLIENMSDKKYIDIKCLKLCRQICHRYYVVTTLEMITQIRISFRKKKFLYRFFKVLSFICQWEL